MKSLVPVLLTACVVLQSCKDHSDSNKYQPAYGSYAEDVPSPEVVRRYATLDHTNETSKYVIGYLGEGLGATYNETSESNFRKKITEIEAQDLRTMVQGMTPIVNADRNCEYNLSNKIAFVETVGGKEIALIPQSEYRGGCHRFYVIPDDQYDAIIAKISAYAHDESREEPTNLGDSI